MPKLSVDPIGILPYWPSRFNGIQQCTYLNYSFSQLLPEIHQSNSYSQRRSALESWLNDAHRMRCLFMRYLDWPSNPDEKASSYLNDTEMQMQEDMQHLSRTGLLPLAQNACIYKSCLRNLKKTQIFFPTLFYVFIQVSQLTHLLMNCRKESAIIDRLNNEIWHLLMC